MFLIGDVWDTLIGVWPHLVGGAAIVVAAVASAHAVLYKRDSRAAIAWVGLIWLSPIVGAVLYGTFGINRIRRRAVALRREQPALALPLRSRPRSLGGKTPVEVPGGEPTARLARFVGSVTSLPLAPGCRVTPLVNGDEAYPAMLAAIRGAERSVALSTYIFDRDELGLEFVEALAAARGRGAEVRVIVDDIGARYHLPTIVGPLRKAGVPVARFLRSLIPVWSPYTNLRNHRKLLVVDGRRGFTGGCNIRRDHLVGRQPRHPIHDLHFEIAGPVVAHLQETFVEDWAFCTEDRLTGEAWFPPLEPAGPVFARGVPAGPDEDFENLHLTLMGALACAQRSVTIVTPYFLPDAPLIQALNVADMRGVDVKIVLPEKSNLSLVQWASSALWWQLLLRGCQIWLTPPPFDHTKLMLVDDCWTLLGSGNWDPRSLRLNFEFNVECYDEALARRLGGIVRDKLVRARSVTLEEMDGRRLPVRFRDGLARLLSPYL